MKYLVFCLLIFPILIMAQPNFDKAEKLYLQGQIAQAKNIFEAILKEDPNNQKTLEYLGDIEGGAQHWDKALFYYQKLKKLKPGEANYHYKFGGVLGMKAKESNKLKALGMIGEVKLSFEKAIQLNPKHVDARWALIELYLQLPGIIGGSESKARLYSNELLKISPVDGYLSRGYIAEYFRRFIEAEENYKKAIEIGGSKTAYQKLSNLYKYKLNQPERAKQVMQAYSIKG